jgi:hypothetical protein
MNGEFQWSRVIRKGVQKTLAREYGAPFAVAAWIRVIDEAERRYNRNAWPTRLLPEEDEEFLRECRWSFELWGWGDALDVIEEFDD